MTDSVNSSNKCLWEYESRLLSCFKSEVATFELSYRLVVGVVVKHYLTSCGASTSFVE